jgi:hypothetical protein
MKAVATDGTHQSNVADDALRLVVDTTPALIHTGRPDGHLDYFQSTLVGFPRRLRNRVQLPTSRSITTLVIVPSPRGCPGAAAERARATPKGQEYQSAFINATKDMMFSGIRDCVPINAPGVRKAPGFQCVLIIAKTGKPKWIIRDSRDPMAQCFYAKLVKLVYPAPPADNWPVMFGINMAR